MGNAPVVDCDQHLYESRDLWASHIDPADRHRALAIEDDDQGYAWLTWQGRRLQLADVQQPGDTAVLGDFRAGQRRGDAAAVRLRRRATRATTGTRRPGATGSTRWAWTARCSSRTSGCCGSGP